MEDTIRFDGPITALQFDSRKIVVAAGENSVRVRLLPASATPSDAACRLITGLRCSTTHSAPTATPAQSSGCASWTAISPLEAKSPWFPCLRHRALTAWQLHRQGLGARMRLSSSCPCMMRAAPRHGLPMVAHQQARRSWFNPHMGWSEATATIQAQCTLRSKRWSMSLCSPLHRGRSHRRASKGSEPIRQQHHESQASESPAQDHASVYVELPVQGTLSGAGYVFSWSPKIPFESVLQSTLTSVWPVRRSKSRYKTDYTTSWADRSS